MRHQHPQQTENIDEHREKDNREKGIHKTLCGGNMGSYTSVLLVLVQDIKKKKNKTKQKTTFVKLK